MRIALVVAGIVSNVAEFDALQTAIDLYPGVTCVDVSATTCGPGWAYDGFTFTPPVQPSVPYAGWKRPLYMSQADKVIQNTVAETSSGAAQAKGSALLAAGSVTPDKLYEFRQFGVVSTGASPVTLTARLKLGGTTVLAVVYNIPANVSDAYWELNGKLMGRVAGAAGSVVAGINLNGPANASITPSPVAVNLAVDQQMDLTYQWGAAAAGNQLTVLNTFLEVST